MGTEAAEIEASPGWLRRIIIGRNPRRTCFRIILWVVGLVFLSRYVLLPVRMQGPSMLPTYRDGGVNIVNRLAYAFREPKRGDVVGIKMAGDHVMLLKRIIALPGETLQFRQGHAYVDGRLIDEPYLKFPSNWEAPPQKIAEDEFYVVGDNRSMAFRDHTKGRAWRKQIAGKVLL